MRPASSANMGSSATRHDEVMKAVPTECESAVCVPVPDAEPVVSACRHRFDASASRGMPAHITALVPFLPVARLSGEVLARLRDLCASVPVLDVQFRHLARFPDVLYLAPEPAGPFTALTESIATAWPEAPPYGGAFADVIPHLTVAQGASDQQFREAEADILARLPLRTRLTHACVYVLDAGHWRVHATLPFAR